MYKELNITDKLEGISKLWEETKGDLDIKIAILDGPVDLSHEALKKADLKSLDKYPNQNIKSSHGTFVTSLIFGAHKQDGVLGIAPDCSGFTRTIYKEGDNGDLNSCSQSDIAQGILDALEKNVDIINISGGEQLAETDDIILPLANALDECEKKGVLVVAATGNEGQNSIHVPASYPTVLSVGSIDEKGFPSVFSNWTEVFSTSGIVAPGEDIVGAIPDGNDKKAVSQGTSFSTALVSGVAALLASLQKQKGIKKDLLRIREILFSSVTPCNENEGINCQRIMNGRLSISNAMNAILNDVSYKKNIKNDSCTKSFGTTTNSKEILTLIDTNMENQTEKNSLPVANDLINQEVSSVTPSSLEEELQNDQQLQHRTVAPSEAVQSCSKSQQVNPSSQLEKYYNPSVDPGGYPTFKNAQLINAIGQPSYNFGTQNNLDTFTSIMKSWYANLPDGKLKDSLTDSPHDHRAMVAFLEYTTEEGKEYELMVSQLIWLLNMNTSPIYVISPTMAKFQTNIYAIMITFLADNVGINIQKYNKYTLDLNEGLIDPNDELPEGMYIETKKDNDLMRMVLPGYISGQTKLINGNYINSVTPVAFGLKNWTLEALIDSLDMKDESEINQLNSILNRLYVSTLNKGQSPEDRALNYSLYNIIELSHIIKEVTLKKLQLSSYKVVPSKIMRQNSISREVQLTFFDPENTNRASVTYSMEIDVSAVTPVLIGETQKWYAPVSVTSA